MDNLKYGMNLLNDKFVRMSVVETFKSIFVTTTSIIVTLLSKYFNISIVFQK